MSVDVFFDEIDELLEKSWTMPLSGGKVVVDLKKLSYLVDKIKVSLPNEIKQAKLIVADRTDIIEDAKAEADGIVNEAEKKAQIMLDQNEIVKQAKAQASDIILNAQTKAKEIRTSTNDYIDDIFKKADEALTANLVDFRKARKSFKEN